MANIYETHEAEMSPYLQQLTVEAEEAKAKEAGEDWRKEKKTQFREMAEDIQLKAKKAAEDAKQGKGRNRWKNLMTAISFIPGFGQAASMAGNILGEGYFANKEAELLKSGLEGLSMGGFEGTFLEGAAEKQNKAIEEVAEGIDPKEAAKAGLMAGGLQAGIGAALGAGLGKLDEVTGFSDTLGPETLKDIALTDVEKAKMIEIGDALKGTNLAEIDLSKGLPDLEVSADELAKFAKIQKLGATESQKLEELGLDFWNKNKEVGEQVAGADFDWSGALDDYESRVFKSDTPFKDYFAGMKEDFQKGTESWEAFGKHAKGKIAPWTQEGQGFTGMYEAFQEGDYDKAFGVWSQPITKELGMDPGAVSIPSAEDIGLQVTPYGRSDWMYDI